MCGWGCASRNHRDHRIFCQGKIHIIPLGHLQPHRASHRIHIQAGQYHLYHSLCWIAGFSRGRSWDWDVPWWKIPSTLKLFATFIIMANWQGYSDLLGNQADTVIRWKLLEYFLVYKFVISYIYSLVCNGICFIPSQTNVRLGFCDKTIVDAADGLFAHPSAALCYVIYPTRLAVPWKTPICPAHPIPTRKTAIHITLFATWQSLCLHSSCCFFWYLGRRYSFIRYFDF